MEEKDIDPKTIRTYESDIANAIQHRQTSQVSMTMAAEEKKRKEAESAASENVLVVNADKPPKDRSKWVKNILMIIVSLILLAAGVAVAYYFYITSPLSVKQPSNPSTTAENVTVPSVVTPDLQKVIDITGQSTGGIIAEIEKESQANPLPDGEILELIVGIQASTTENGKTVSTLTRVTGPQFISALGLVPPDALTSSLTNQWMLGTYSQTDNDNASGTVSAPFIILTTNFFQNAFAGMLKWEPSMASDLSGLFGLQPSQWSAGSFQDKVIKNKDVREFVDGNGNTLFLYSFISDGTLVIAQNEATLSEIITRFENQAYVR